MVVDKKNEEEKRKNKITITIFSVYAGICSISFTNMAIMGINFTEWIALVITVLIFICIMAGIAYIDIFFDTIRKEYLGMIKDLEELKFKFY